MKCFFFTFCIFLLACSEKEHQLTDTINDTLQTTGDTAEVADEKNDTLIINPDLEFEVKASEFLTKYLKWYDQQEARSGILPQRFACDTLIQFSLKKKNGVMSGDSGLIYPVGNFYFFSYSDTLTFQNALNNWYNCFGNDCSPVISGTDLKSIKSTPSFTIIGKNQIVHLNYSCEHTDEDWKKTEKELLMLFGKNRKEIIRVGCGGPLQWE